MDKLIQEAKADIDLAVGDLQEAIEIQRDELRKSIEVRRVRRRRARWGGVGRSATLTNGLRHPQGVPSHW